MMDHPAALVLFAMLGVALGGLFFGGLWWTVRRLPRSRSPWLLYFVSMLVRLAVLLGVLLLIMRSAGDWKPLAACLAGFFVTRLALLQWARPGREPGTVTASHERAMSDAGAANKGS